MSKCKKRTTKKYTTRKSPAYPANECCGKKKKGNDGNFWVSKPDKNGVCRWVRSGGSSKASRRVSSHSSSKKKWLTLDNGGRPFYVVYDGSSVKIFKDSVDDDAWVPIDVENYTTLVKQYKNVEKVFVGKDRRKSKRFDGNSILLRLPRNRHVFIGEEVYEFTPPEPITRYYSLVGNSSVPYPVALSSNYAYFMLDAPRHYKDDRRRMLDYIPREEFPKDTDWADAYTEYYRDYASFDVKPPVKRMNVKVIHERI